MNFRHQNVNFLRLQDSLRQYLLSMCHYGHVIRRCHAFCAELTRASHVMTGGGHVGGHVTSGGQNEAGNETEAGMENEAGGRTVCRTYVAFATALHSHLTDMKTQLCELEKQCIQNGKFIMICSIELKTYLFRQHYGN